MRRLGAGYGPSHGVVVSPTTADVTFGGLRIDRETGLVMDVHF